ncbi:hypothetical protein BCR37DRAFT_377670 [Protomyces lactucae-debilis]|uniref:NADH dehydrogenase [ubiquinone] 1 beta subcomplex subunit 4 n=1 Tax=Protomyces lactucae-debilis TaxID=2754530 RepID=A0A1Y2FLJ7_PROLT|nr:uncharacterized protein BCR37DRAFT_377670 [Protomyces lactucae-debilis]ORY84840.1 hypothetical protein BCR37DRAFT_377670 [Protomyces lactucae-debilis]
MGETLKKDPAIERWVEMRHDLYRNFRWTSKSTRQVAMWGVAFPVALYYLAYATEGKWQLRGKTRGESITEK